jgi:hypothetical protein
MVYRRSRIAEKVKLQVISELQTGCAIKDLSSKYGISGWTIGKWRKEMGALTQSQSSTASDNPGNKFIELSVLGSINPSGLVKASLVFRDFSVIVEGSISSTKLISILKILEGTC